MYLNQPIHVSVVAAVCIVVLACSINPRLSLDSNLIVFFNYDARASG